ncbi:transporter substrate-binding domain-containing protein [Pseudomonas sp. NPDC008258]|uniref:ABC transporter substrate-binding protein n=1 Tax=Pseudomonas sp. NPDC008258 TaxID=3364418 RepID=UPI0036E858B7
MNRLFLAATLTLGIWSGMTHAADKVIAGIEASFPPWAYVEKGEVKGIAIDAMKEIAKSQDLEVEFQDLPWPSLIPSLAGQKIDLIVTGLNVTETRAKVLDFAIPWWQNNDEVLIPRNSDKNVVTALCCNASVGAQGGGTQFEWLNRNLVKNDVGVTLRSYEDLITAIEDMHAGRLQAVVTSTDTAEDLIAKGQPIKIAGTIIQNQPQALAVKKGDPKGLLPKLNAGILALNRSGQWEKIVHQYSPQSTIRPIPAYMPDYVQSYKAPIPGYTAE